jgi:uncharacterized protein (DUF983 family)
MGFEWMILRRQAGWKADLRRVPDNRWDRAGVLDFPADGEPPVTHENRSNLHLPCPPFGSVGKLQPGFLRFAPSCGAAADSNFRRKAAADPVTMKIRLISALVVSCQLGWGDAKPEEPSHHLAMAKEVTADIHSKYWMPERLLYRQKLGKDDPEMVWGGGILFSMLVAAARHEPETYKEPLFRFYDGLNTYWDTGVKIPGYEPCPTKGGGNDKYYDDNAWLVLNFAEAYQLTGDRKFIRRAYETLTFVMSGWDDTLGGGIWWHEKRKDNSKNTCINAPAAVGCLTIAKFRPDRRRRMTEKAVQIADWTRKTLQAENGLYMDAINAETRKINRVTLTYNSALMLRAELMLHDATGEESRLREAVRIGKAADGLCHRGTGIYRDPPRWSHLMVEADLELHRRTGDARALERARATAGAFYQNWKDGKVEKLIDQASIARTLWLMVDQETETGRSFWKKMDEQGRSPEK